MTDVFKEAKDILDSVELAEEQRKKEVLTKCDWKDPSDKAFYLNAKRKGERKAIIDKQKGVCPFCNKPTFSSRSWVVDTEKRTACCRSCYFNSGHNVGVGFRSKRTVFGERTIRVAIDGFQLVALRDELGISQAGFARKAGWSNVYQHKLETSVRSVNLEVAEVILEVLEEFHCFTGDSL